FNASLDKASLDNEQNAVVLETPGGKTIMFNQIAGLIARRIVCHALEGMVLMKGDRFGIIKFGSRLDVYLPPEARVNVKNGDRVKAGTSIIGYWT
ncbi:MAG: phosphatidylserine decarboxylase, partial [Deltaproteobacteria bacterium]|nr:phosphatidylserine decarboxylase [Deltaproteobacteria bacterium]